MIQVKTIITQHLEVKMSNNKQSSVEFLIEKLFNSGVDTTRFIKEIQQAKAMHKEEIKIAYMEGAFEKMRHFDGKEPMIPTEYYNETYGGNNE